MAVPVWQKPRAPPDGLVGFGDISCGSSVVEHSLGKGEVESSILSRSTIKNPFSISRLERNFDLRLAGQKTAGKLGGSWRVYFDPYCACTWAMPGGGAGATASGIVEASLAIRSGDGTNPDAVRWPGAGKRSEPEWAESVASRTAGCAGSSARWPRTAPRRRA
jgi:hypothetical protein